MNSSENVLAVDGTWLLHRAFHVASLHSNPGDRIASLLISWISKYALRFKAKKVLVGFDGPKVFRYEIYPRYKANRKGELDLDALPNEGVVAEKGGPYEHLELVMGILNRYGFTVLQLAKYEADDLLATMATYCTANKIALTLVSKDKDSLQLLSSYVQMFSPGSKPEDDKIITTDTLLKEKGKTPEQFLFYQILVGDKGDNVLGLVSEGVAKNLNKRFNKKSFRIRLKEKGEEDLLQHFDLNTKLVTLVGTAFPVDLDSYAVKPNKAATKPDAYLQYVEFLKKRSLF